MNPVDCVFRRVALAVIEEVDPRTSTALAVITPSVAEMNEASALNEPDCEPLTTALAEMLSDCPRCMTESAVKEPDETYGAMTASALKLPLCTRRMTAFAVEFPVCGRSKTASAVRALVRPCLSTASALTLAVAVFDLIASAEIPAALDARRTAFAPSVADVVRNTTALASSDPLPPTRRIASALKAPLSVVCMTASAERPKVFTPAIHALAAKESDCPLSRTASAVNEPLFVCELRIRAASAVKVPV